MRKFMGFPELSFNVRKGGKMNMINNLGILLNELVSALKNFINFKVFEITILNFLVSSLYSCRCSVCLVEYQAEDRLQHIPACGHTFHTDCIDHWLATHTTCPLCRLSLVPASKSSTELPQINVESGQEFSVAVNGNDTSIQQRPQASVAEQAEEDIRNPKNKSEEDAREVRNPKNEDARSSDCVDHVRESRSSRDDIE